MELTEIIRTLWQRKVALAIVVGLALLAALSTVYRISPSGLSSRSYEFGAAQAQLLVDSPRSSLLDLTQETPPLAERAAVYAQFMRSNAIKAAIAKEAGIPVNQVDDRGPLHRRGRDAEHPAARRDALNEIRGEGKLYRLVFDYQPDLPVISIYAQAPTEEAAVKLAERHRQGRRAYINQLEDESEVPDQARDAHPRAGTGGGRHRQLRRRPPRDVAGVHRCAARRVWSDRGSRCAKARAAPGGRCRAHSRGAGEPAGWAVARPDRADHRL